MSVELDPRPVSSRDDAMAATAFTKFDPLSFLENRESADALAKPAKVAKGHEVVPIPLATLAVSPDSQDFEAAARAVIKHDLHGRRAWPAGSSAQPAPFASEDRSGIADHAGQRHDDVQVSCAGLN